MPLIPMTNKVDPLAFVFKNVVIGPTMWCENYNYRAGKVEKICKVNGITNEADWPQVAELIYSLVDRMRSVDRLFRDIVGEK